MMNRAPLPQPSRRALIAGLGLMAVPGLLPVLARAAAPAKIVTLLGDSITAGYGLAQRDSLPVQLELALGKLGVDAKVRGAGVSGDTTADGLARVDFSVRSDTDLCLVELGGNDLLQGDDAATTRANLTAILTRLKARHIKVALIGLHAPDQIGVAFAHDFNAAFTAAAEASHAPLYPSLLTGVAGNPALVQGDHIHPNAAGVKVIVARLAPFVAKHLK
jgi:acyl-CoA thioesterase-1